MNIKNLKVAEVRPYPNNPRRNQGAVSTVAESIKEFGFQNPIVVDKNYEIIVGHTRFEASKLLGYEEVPVIIADNLTPEQVKAFRIMDNKSSELAEWDTDKLMKELEELGQQNYDTILTGFDDIEVNDLIADFSGGTMVEHEAKLKPEVEFSEELLEEHNYVVLYFDNTLDWQVAKDVFGLGTVKALASKDGYIKNGTGRVVKGAKYLERLKGDN